MKFLLSGDAGLALLQKFLGQSQKHCTLMDGLGNACPKNVGWQPQTFIYGRAEEVSNRSTGNSL
jgi:hypothetical protein